MSYDRRRGKVGDALKHAVFAPYYVVKGLFEGETPVESIQQISNEVVAATPEAVQDIKEGANWVAESVGELSSSFLSGLGITNLLLIIGAVILALFIIIKVI